MKTAGKGMSEPLLVRWLLTGVALAFLALFLFVPLAALFAQAFEKGAGAYFAAIREPDALLAIKLTLVTAALFADMLKVHAQDFAEATGVPTEVVAVANTHLGETITVAGLLMGEDVVAQLAKRELGEVVVLPRVMFDHPDGVSLDDRSPLDIAKALGRPVALADLMGDVVDVLHGQAAMLFDPVQGPLISPEAIQRSGGWAVEKYL
jgi:hypothetical protein